MLGPLGCLHRPPAGLVHHNVVVSVHLCFPLRHVSVPALAHGVVVLGAGPSGVQRPAGIIPFRFNRLLRFCSSRTQGLRSSVVSRAESLDLCDDLSEAPDRDKDFAHGVLLVQLGVLVDCDVSVGQGEGVMEGGVWGEDVAVSSR